MLLMIEKPRPTPAERAWAALLHSATAVLKVADGFVMGPFRAIGNRRLVDTLAAMSDHDLKDIGLTRHDLRDSAALPAGRDASRFLADRREARRLRR